MKTNEGTVDRVIRVALGIGLLSLLAVGPIPGWGLAGLVGVLPLLTGTTGYCPTYTLFGMDTRARAVAPGREEETPWTGC